MDNLKYFEKKNKVKININCENSMSYFEYILDFKNKSRKTLEKIENFSQLKNLGSLGKNKIIKIKTHKKNKFKRKKFKRKIK